MKIKFLAGALCFMQMTLQTAAPVTHIILALAALPHLPAHIDKKAFIVGTSFPDIRYHAHLARSTTHLEPATWNDICKEPSSFKAGMLFHNLVDNVRIQSFEPFFYFRKAPYSKIYRTYFPLTMKTAEDYVLYDLFDDWPTIAGYFDTIYQEERNFDIDEHILKRWHALLQHYFTTKPTIDAAYTFLSPEKIQSLQQTGFDMHQEFNNLIANDTFHTRLQQFYNQFLSLSNIQ